MPNYKREEAKFYSRGLNLTRPQDLQETKTNPYLLNMRQHYQGAFQNRPGMVAINSTPLADLNLHSVVRLNDYMYDEFTRFVGAGDALYSHTTIASEFAERATGFSGNPLALCVMRPPQSPEPWVYIGDTVQSGKGRVDGTFYEHGIAPPTTPAYAQPAATAYKVIETFESAGAWIAGGTASGLASLTRVSTTIEWIVYDTGTDGWATIAPIDLDENIQPGMFLVVAGTETILVESVTEAVTNTTISAIQYDSGTTGNCTIQLANPTARLVRDSMVLLDPGGAGEEAVRVVGVTDGPNNLPSFRCATVNTQAAATVVEGLRSFRAVLAATYVSSDALASNYLAATVAVGVGHVSLTIPLDLSSLNGRPIIDSDEMHISINIDLLGRLTEGRIFLDVDATTNDFTRNYYYKAFRANDLTLATTNDITTLAAQQRVIQRTGIETTYFGTRERVLELNADGFSFPDLEPVVTASPNTQTTLGEVQWTELRFKIKPSELIRVGSDTSRSLHDVAALRVQLQVTDTVQLGVAAWWVGGTFGADVLPSVGVGAPYNYRYVYRSKVTGATSNPAPPMRSGVTPRRQQVVGEVTASLDPQVDVIDIYRTGGALIVSDNTPPWFYVMTIPNDDPEFLDDYPDDIVIRNQQLSFTNHQPFLDVDIPRSGTCDVVGTEVTQTGGDLFNILWPEGVIILINNVPYTLNQQPSSTTQLSLTQNAGTLNNVTWIIQNPRIAAQPMPALWGPYNAGGTIEPLLFATGSLLQPGTVFFTKPGNPDGHSQFGSLQLTSTSEPLINGVVFRAQSYVFSSEALYLLTPSGIVGAEIQFSGQRVAGNRGLFSRYALCVGDEGIFYLSEMASIKQWVGSLFVSPTNSCIHYSCMKGHRRQPR